jgi:hypothetical protein
LGAGRRAEWAADCLAVQQSAVQREGRGCMWEAAKQQSRERHTATAAAAETGRENVVGVVPFWWSRRCLVVVAASNQSNQAVSAAG